MILRCIGIGADPELVERYQDGFFKRFIAATFCITNHFTKLIGNSVTTPNTNLAGFEFTDAILEPPEKYGVWHCRWPFQFEKYKDASSIDKKRMILDALYDALLWMGKREGWNTEPFHSAYQTIIDLNFKYTGTSKKSWLSPDKKYRAKLYFDFDIESVQFEAILLRAKSPMEIVRKPIGSVKSHIQSFECVGACEWISPYVFKVSALPEIFLRHEWKIDFSEHMKG